MSGAQRWLAFVLIAVCAATMGCDDGDAEMPAPADMAAVGDADLADASPTDAGLEPDAMTPESIAAATDLTRFAEHLAFVAEPRPQGSAHWQAVQDRCASVLAEAGFTVERHAFGRETGGMGTNVIGVRAGVERPEEFVMLAAHYDGRAACAGANANASGVAALLDAAQALGAQTYARSVIVACFDERDLASGGARAWIARHARQGRTVHASLHLESIGYTSDTPDSQALPAGFDILFPTAGAFVAERQSRGDFIAAIGDASAAPLLADLNAHAERIELPMATIEVAAALRTDPSLAALQRGDHRWFWANDWPAAQLTDTGPFRDVGFKCEYVADDVDRVDAGFAHKVAQAAAFAIATQAQVHGGAPQPLQTDTDPAPVSPPCDLVAQDCPADEKCIAITTSAGSADPYTITCAPRVDMPVAPGPPDSAEACSRTGGVGEDDCAAGSFCTFWGLPRSRPQRRICLPFCATDADCAIPGDQCVHLFRTHNRGMCTAPCDPLDAEACPGGRCVELGSGQVYNRDYPRFLCLPRDGEMQAEGEPCSPEMRCLKGLRCHWARAGRAPVCTRWCADNEDCADGQDCQPSGAPGVGWCNQTP